MTIRNLDKLFKPSSVALIGASNQPQTVGQVVAHNLWAADFRGPIMPVSPRHAAIGGVLTYADVASLPVTPDLAIICTPPETVPALIDQLGSRGTKGAVVITAGFGEGDDERGKALLEAMLKAAQPHLLRIVGPNCLGLVVPPIELNGSFAHLMPGKGDLAFVSQSGAILVSVIDWAVPRRIGFSHLISLGTMADVDFGDVLDYLAGEHATRAILLYVEAVTNARKFMSAARAAARAKPVIAVKTGRVAASARAAASHTGALAGDDEIVDAVLRRAGILRVDTTQDLFDAAETLARGKPFLGERVAIMTNGGGAGVLATDALVRGGGTLATLSEATLASLDACLPPTWSRANPLDIIGDAPVGRYIDTLTALESAPEVDAVLFLHAPTAIVPATEVAAAVAPVIRRSGKNILTSFLGGAAVGPARALLAAGGVPGYATPEEAARAYLQLVDYARLQTLLLETPRSHAGAGVRDPAPLRALFASALAAGRTLLDEVEAKQVLQLAGIPVVATEIARDATEAAAIATRIGTPVALKILSPDISHKSDVGGVALNLADGDEVADAAAAMQARIARSRPAARLAGFTVQAMARTGGAHELIIGCVADPVFGPMLMFGQGGTAVEVIRDRAFALPPLNEPLARALIARTRVAALLAGYRDRPPIDHEALVMTLLRVSALVCACPEIVELDINPLLADAQGVCALDARVRIAPATGAPDARLLIRPYPQQLEEAAALAGQMLQLRPIRPEDEAAHAAFLSRVSPEDFYFRFFQATREWTHRDLARLTQIDYDREMAFVAIDAAPDREEILGVARCIADPDNLCAEFAVIVRSDRHGQGLGKRLMEKLIAYCEARGTGRLNGFVLAANVAMLGLARALGFTVAGRDETGVIEVVLELPRRVAPAR